MNREAQEQLAELLLGASESVDVLGTVGLDWLLPLEDISTLVDQRLPMRWLVRNPVLFGIYEKRATEFMKSITNAGWEARIIEADPTIHCVIVDRQEALMLPVKGFDATGPAFHISNPDRLQSVLDHFDRLWKASDTSGEVTLFHESLLQPATEEAESRIALASTDVWDRVIADLAANPDRLYELHPRGFEELVAELLLRKGMKVTLTPATRDGGRDILAANTTAMGNHLYLVECKRFASHRPVGVSIVRELYGVISHEQATAGMLVTTSYFTKDALAFRAGIQYRLGLTEYQDLAKWLKSEAGA